MGGDILMQLFQDTATSKIWAFEDDVVVTDSAGMYSFKTASGAALATPATLRPFTGVWPPAPPPPTLPQQAAAALAAGLTIALSGTMTLAATAFPTDPATTTKIGAVVTTLLATSAFPGGATSYPMKDATGAWHTFNAAQYTKVAGALAAYVAALDLIADGNPLGATALPTASITLTV